MRMVELLFHLNIWRINVAFNLPINRDCFYNFHPLTKERYNYILNSLFRRYSKIESIDKDDLSIIISYINEYMVHLSIAYSNIAANTFSLYDIFKFEKGNPMFKKLVNTELSDKSSVKETELFLDSSKLYYQMPILKDGKNNLLPYIQAKRFNLTQLVQMFVAVGYRTDIDKNIIPKPISRGFIKGFTKPSEFYAESKVSLIDLINRHKYVPESGYLSQKINLASLDTEIDSNCDDCGTKHLLTIYIGNRGILKVIEGKYMETKKGLVPILLTDEHLIGKEVKIRTMVTCCCPSKYVCKKCVGTKSDRLKGTRIGGLPAPKFMSPIFQITLSTKHKTESDSIELNSDLLNKFCLIDSNDIYIRSEYCIKGNFFNSRYCINR